MRRTALSVMPGRHSLSQRLLILVLLACALASAPSGSMAQDTSTSFASLTVPQAARGHAILLPARDADADGQDNGFGIVYAAKVIARAYPVFDLPPVAATHTSPAHSFTILTHPPTGPPSNV